MAILTTAT